MVPIMELEDSSKVPWGGQDEGDRFVFVHVLKVPLKWHVKWGAGHILGCMSRGTHQRGIEK